MLRIVSCLLFCASLLLGQIPPIRFNAHKTTVLAAAVEKVTIQQPATGSKRVILESAYTYCSVVCTITFSVDGAAATATALTRNQLFRSGTTTAATATAWSGSDVGAGTAISPAYNVAAGTGQSFDLAGVVLQGDGTGKNFTVATNSITGTVQIVVTWREEAP